MIRIYQQPDQQEWKNLCRRPNSNDPVIQSRVSAILNQVRAEGDAALRRLTLEHDGADLDSLELNPALLAAAEGELPTNLTAAIRTAFENIRRFHEAQLGQPLRVETMPGVVCSRVRRPITHAGLYIPGGSAPLFSTVLMLGVPASLAGCREVIICTPPDKNGNVHPAIRFAAHLCGIRRIFRLGGAQAVAAMAYGTETIPQVHKIFGPGNAYVTQAKQLVMSEGIAIDMPAGPSEVLVIADASADPDFVAADLLSQAEHGADSQAVLVSDSPALVERVNQSLQQQLNELPRKDIARQAVAGSFAVCLPSLEACVDFSNVYAPEHLIINTTDAEHLLNRVEHAGSVFLGAFTPEAAGDYASGTNHTLPTNGFARAYSGVSIDSFTKQMTVQQITPEGLKTIGPVIEAMADAEQLDAHRRAVRIRLNKLS